MYKIKIRNKNKLKTKAEKRTKYKLLSTIVFIATQCELSVQFNAGAIGVAGRGWELSPTQYSVM